jgi:tetratricopeptide (TPR) repeat protein
MVGLAPSTPTGPGKTGPGNQGSGTTGPGVPAAPSQVALDHLKSGDLDKVNPAHLDETKANELIARAEHRWLTYLRQEKGKDPTAVLKADAPPVQQALTDLNKDLVKNLPDAIYLRGQIYEMTGKLDEAKKEYSAGVAQFKDNEEQKERFEAALLVLSFRAGRVSVEPRPGATRQLTRWESVLAGLFLFQAAEPPPALPKEAGFSFWKAVGMARDGKYSDAIVELKKARDRHDQRRFLLPRKPQNPTSDPSGEIFLRVCDELKAAWEVEGKLRDPNYLTADPKDRVKALDEFARAAQAGLIKDMGEKLLGKDKVPAKADDLVSAIEEERKTSKEKITDLDKMVTDLKKETADLKTNLKDAQDLAKATADKLKDAEMRETALKEGLAGRDAALAKIGAEVGVKFTDLKKDGTKLVEEVKQTARIANVKDPAGMIRKLEQETASTRAVLAERWKPEQMLSFWLPVVDQNRKRKDLAESALRDVERVNANPEATGPDRTHAEVIRGLVLRNEEKFGEAEPLLARARNDLIETRGEWLTRVTDALREVSNPAAYYARKADDLVAVGRPNDALAVLQRASQVVPADERGPILARRSLLALESAKARGAVRAGNESVIEARRDADAAARAGSAEGHYAAGRIAEELGQYPQAAENYRAAIRANPAVDGPGSRYRVALARVLLRSRTPDAGLRPGAMAPVEEGRQKAVAELNRTDLTVLVLTMMLQAPGLPGGVPTAEQKEAERLADEVLAQGNRVPFDVRAQALAIKGLYTRALMIYTEGLRERGLLAPGYANTLLDLVRNHPALRRPETFMIPDPLEGERHFANGLNFFFARNYVNAEREFLAAIENDNADARYFYFLGMSRLMLGKREGYEDLDQGARLERLGRPDRGAVSASLERVQGQLRQIVNAIRTRPVKDVSGR